MLTFIVIILFGISFGFLATQNTAAATFNVLGYTWTLPIYMIVFGSLLIGFFISWIVNSINAIGNWSNVHGKDRKIHESQQTVAQLQNKINDLEHENARLKGHNDLPQRETVAEKQVTDNKQHNFLDRFRRNSAY